MEPEDTGYHHAHFNLSAMSDEQLFGLQRRAFRRFFLSPRRALRIAARHPAKLELLRYGMITALKMLPHPGRKPSIAPGGSTIGPAQSGEQESARLHLATAWDAAEPVRRLDPRARKPAPSLPATAG
jgi:hypothetical protein